MNRPDMRELECFAAVAETLNFSRAARQLHLSQPPLTRHIQSLEHKLGVRLLNRNTHSVSLTPAGNLYLEDTREILSSVDRSMAAVRRAGEGEGKRLKIAFVGSLLDSQLIRFLQAFREVHSACQLQLDDLPPASQITAILDGRIDGGFIGAKPSRSPTHLDIIVWKNEPLVVALPEHHPLATEKRLSWRSLRDEPWVMVSRDAAPAFRQQFAGLCSLHGLKGKVIQEAERVPAILTMVASGSGISLLPEGISHLINEGVVFRPVIKSPQLQHCFASRAGEAGEPMREFLALLKKMKQRIS